MVVDVDTKAVVGRSRYCHRHIVVLLFENSAHTTRFVKWQNELAAARGSSEGAIKAKEQELRSEIR